MNQRWKATMPKEPPREGMSHFVFAFKDGDKGVRVELTGQAKQAELLRILNMLANEMKQARTAQESIHD